MQKFEILLSLPITADTENPGSQSSLASRNGYLSYNQSGLGGGIVTEFNVRQFLESPSNESISVAFLSYLSGNTSNLGLQEINESDSKLSNVFNKFYQTTILSGTSSPTAYINQELTGTSLSAVSTYTYDYVESKSHDNNMYGSTQSILNNNLIKRERLEVKTYTDEISYYLPISINRNYVDMARMDFTEFTKDCFRDVINSSGITETKFLTQCFVDLNKAENPNDKWFNPKIKNVTFEFNSYNVQEPENPGGINEIGVKVLLDNPSESGIEFLTIEISEENSTASPSDFSILLDGVEYESQVPIQFNKGESEKVITIRVFGDIEIENDEYITLAMSNLFNLESGSINQTTIVIGDSTVLFESDFSNVDTKYIGERISANSSEDIPIKRYAALAPLPSTLSLAFNNAIAEIRDNPDPSKATKILLKSSDDFKNMPFTDFDDVNSVYSPNRDKRVKFKFDANLIYDSFSAGVRTAVGSYSIYVRVVAINSGGDRRILYFSQVEGSAALNQLGENRITSHTSPFIQVFEGESYEISYAYIQRANTRNKDTSINPNIRFINTNFQVSEVENEIIEAKQDTLIMNVSEEAEKIIEISLSSPSLYGVEKMDVNLKLPDNTYPGTKKAFSVFPNTLTWGVGEITKQFTISYVEPGFPPNFDIDGVIQLTSIEGVLPLRESIEINLIKT